MRYPLVPEPAILDFVASAQDKTWDLALPSKPSLPDCIAGFGIELGISLQSDNTTGTGPNMFITGGSHLQHLARALAVDSVDAYDNNTVILALDPAATTVFIKSDNNNNKSGTMQLKIWARAYHY